MIQVLVEAERLLKTAGIVSFPVDLHQRDSLSFESATILGFLIVYENSDRLLRNWADDSRALIARHHFALRRADAKSWNTYTVFLAQEPATPPQAIALNAAEEDLAGTRKIARAGIQTTEDLRIALLPLLPIQNVPQLEPIDMIEEIGIRTTALPRRIVEAFLSSADESSVLQALEEEP